MPAPLLRDRHHPKLRAQPSTATADALQHPLQAAATEPCDLRTATCAIGACLGHSESAICAYTR
jgi:hypothetical protein